MPTSVPTLHSLRVKIHSLEEGPTKHRLSRIMSWLALAATDRGSDAKCVFLWIAFNAAYAIDRNRDFSRTSGEANEWQRRRDYFRKVVPLDAERIYCLMGEELRQPILKIVDNEYVHHGLWKSLTDEPFDWSRWASRDDFERHRDRIGHLLRQYGRKRRSSTPRTRAVLEILNVLFDRLYVLRNQLMHGCSTHQGAPNRRQVEEGACILSSLMPLFLDIMADHSRVDWGAIAFPVRVDIREDLRGRPMR